SVVTLSRATMPFPSNSLDMTGRLSPFCGDRITFVLCESRSQGAYSRSRARLLVRSAGDDPESRGGLDGRRRRQGTDLRGVSPLDRRLERALEVRHVIAGRGFHLPPASAQLDPGRG